MKKPSSPTQGLTPITEDDIASYLQNTPDFFERHAEVLSGAQLSSPHGNRAISLQERQAIMLRDRIKLLEQRIMEMIRHGTENMGIAARTHQWSLRLLRARNPEELPGIVVDDIRERFSVPQIAIRLWDIDERYRHHGFAQPVSDNTRAFTASLNAPFCGANLGFESVEWLGDSASARSIALLPLREGSVQSPGAAFGLLVLASPDPLRFEAGMGTDFLELMAELASAALSRLRA